MNTEKGICHFWFLKIKRKICGNLCPSASRMIFCGVLCNSVVFVIFFSFWPELGIAQSVSSPLAGLTGLTRTETGIEIEKLNKLVEEVKAGLTKQEETIQRLKESIKLINQQQIQCSSETFTLKSTFKEEMMDFTVKMNGFSQEIQNLIKTIEGLQTQTGQLDKQIIELKNSLTNLNNNLFELQTQLGIIKEKTGLTRGKIESAADTLVVLREEQVKLEQGILRCRKEIEYLKGEGQPLVERAVRSPWFGITAFVLGIIALIIAL